mmetsp:Transcript_6916/g.15118  ORF Transcript_6916/g.15118 Transcript_6916/m.15118 type:complete len:255 (+) Transcript_6916:348-1112(+)
MLPIRRPFLAVSPSGGNTRPRPTRAPTALRSRYTRLGGVHADVHGVIPSLDAFTGLVHHRSHLLHHDVAGFLRPLQTNSSRSNVDETGPRTPKYQARRFRGRQIFCRSGVVAALQYNLPEGLEIPEDILGVHQVVLQPPLILHLHPRHALSLGAESRFLLRLAGGRYALPACFLPIEAHEGGVYITLGDRFDDFLGLRSTLLRPGWRKVRGCFPRSHDGEHFEGRNELREASLYEHLQWHHLRRRQDCEASSVA